VVRHTLAGARAAVLLLETFTAKRQQPSQLTTDTLKYMLALLHNHIKSSLLYLKVLFFDCV
jgi:hypothetical protein